MNKEKQLKRLLKELLEDEAEQVPEESELRKRHTFSEPFLKEMDRLAKKEDGREKGQGRRLTFRLFVNRHVLALSLVAAAFMFLCIFGGEWFGLMPPIRVPNEDTAAGPPNDTTEFAGGQESSGEGSGASEEAEESADQGTNSSNTDGVDANRGIYDAPPELTLCLENQKLSLSPSSYTWETEVGGDWNSVKTDAASPLMAHYEEGQTLFLHGEAGSGITFRFPDMPDEIGGLHRWDNELYQKEDGDLQGTDELVKETTEEGVWLFICPEEGGIYELSVRWEREKWKGTASYYFRIQP